jgi:PAS domain S-box-containing protein/putative nucleotidyltransferase with HDIG domain
LATLNLPALKENTYTRRKKVVRKENKLITAVELRYRAILEQIPAIIYTDSPGEFNQTLYINPRVELITGYTAEEWIADSLLWFKIIHEDDKERVWEENRRTESNGEPFKEEYRIHTRHGQLRWVHDEAWLIRDAENKPLFWQGFIIDITDRKQAEMELATRANELSALQETVLNLTARHSLPDLLNLIMERATQLLNANNGMLYLSDNAAQMVRCVVSYHTQKDYTGSVLRYGEGAAGRVARSGRGYIIKNYARWSGGKGVFEAEDPLYQSVISAPMVWQGQVNGVLQLRKDHFTKADLDQLNLFANHAAVAVENARLYDAAAQELEERKRAEQALRESVVIYRQAIESTGGVPYYQTYADGKSTHYDFIGDGIQEITGYSADEFNAKIWESLLLETLPTVDAVGRSIDDDPLNPGQVARQNSTWKCEYRIQARDGRIHWVFDSAVMLRDDNGNIEGSIGLYRDITQSKRVEQVQGAIYRISQAVVTTRGLEELFHSIHRILGELMPVENFYIALYDPYEDLLSFPYYIDLYDQPPPPARPERGLTEYVMRTKKPLWAPEKVFQELIQNGEVEVVGSDSIDWIGVPLKIGDRVTGVMVAQSYTEGVLFNQDDLDLMEFVSTQVAVSIERKKTEDALRLSLDETQRYAERMALLNRIARAASSTLNLDNLLELIYHEIVAAVPSDSFFVALYDHNSDQVEFRIRVDRDVHEPPHKRSLGNALTAYVINNKKSLLIRDYELEKANLPKMSLWGTGEPSRSWLGVPMLLGKDVLGLISVQSYSPNAYGERERELLSTIADTIAMAIENAHLYEAEKQRAARLTQIVQLGTELASLRNEEEMLETLVKRTQAIMDSATCTVMLIDREKNEAVLAAQTGLPHNTGKLRVGLASPVIHKLIELGEPLIVPNIDKDEPAIRQILVREDINAFFAYPMTRNGLVIGVITISGLTPFSPSSEEISACRLLAERVAAALENARLFEKTERHLRQVQALRTIDAAIASSFDLKVILNVIIQQIVTQLKVDAVDVLLLNPHSYALEYSVGRGFNTNAIEKNHFLLGEGMEGQQVIEQRTIHIPDLDSVRHSLLRADIFSAEGFVSYSAAPLVAKGDVKGVLEVYQRTPSEHGPEWLEFLETLAGQLAIAIDNAQLFANLQRSNLDLSLAYDATIEGWSRALDMRDRVTEGHTRRVTELALYLARAMGMSEADLVHMRRGILLHDIGKMGIPDTILLKAGPLTEEEASIMRKHTQYAFDMLAPISYLRPALDIPASHHEKWNGTGYPHGLKGEQIPLSVRIFTVVDVFDALTSDRPYRKAWTKEQGLQYISDEKGKSFDPRVVDTFLSLRREMGIEEA